MLIGVSIIVNGYFVCNAINSIYMSNSITTLANNSIDSNVLNLSQVAKYLTMSEEEVEGIIQTEQNIIDKTHSFDGLMFPYFTINNKKYFYKDLIDDWLKEVSSRRREYDTKSGWIL